MPQAVADKQTLVVVTGCALLSLALMVSQAMELVTRAFYARSDLDLILASPVAARKVFAVRIATMALSVTMMAMLLAAPFINVLAFEGGARWLGAYGVVAAMGAAATAFAVALTVALFRSIGPKRTRLVAQIVAAVIGAAFVIGLQVGAILSYGTLSRIDFLQSDAVLARAPDADSIVWWPARAILGDPQALAVVLGASFVLLAAAIAAFSARFGDHAIAAAGVAGTRVRQAPLVERFRRASPKARCGSKEWTLLRRDPWLVSQTLMQMLYLIPPALMLWKSFGDGTGALRLAGAGSGHGGRTARRRPRVARDLGRGRARSRRHRAGAGALDRARQDRGRDRRHRHGVRAAGRGDRVRVAVACAGDGGRRSRRRLVLDRDPALVPLAGKTQPLPPPADFVAARDLRRGVLVDQLGRHRRADDGRPGAGGAARPDGARRARRRPLAQSAKRSVARMSAAICGAGAPDVASLIRATNADPGVI